MRDESLSAVEGGVESERASVLSAQIPLHQLEAKICSSAGRIAVATSALLALLLEFDRRNGWAQYGLKSCAHWLAWACSMSPAAAREHMRIARKLDALPLVRAEFAQGVLSYSKVRAMTRVSDRIDEQTLLNLAIIQTASQLERTVRGFRKADGEGRSQQRSRRARVYWDDDGMLVFSARLPADEGALVMAAIETFNQEPATGSAARDLQAADADRMDIDFQRMSVADSVVAICASALQSGGGDSSGDDRNLVVIHVDSATLSTQAEMAAQALEITPNLTPTVDQAICQLADGPGLDTAATQRISCDAGVLAMIKGTGKGVLDVGRRTRKISPPLRRALRLRDGGCRFPGCHRRSHLEAHHIKHWSRGGATDRDNLLLLCRFHHMAVHEGGFQIEAVPQKGGELSVTFRRPDGAVVPNVRPLSPEGAPALSAVANNPDDIRSKWLGERFVLADNVAVLIDSPIESRISLDVSA